MVQTIIVTVVAMSALGVIVRRYSSSWLPTAFRPVRRHEGCDSCPLVTGDADPARARRD
jgi:hypothetical protein